MHVNTTNAVISDGMFGLFKAAGYNTGVFGKVTNDQANILDVSGTLLHHPVPAHVPHTCTQLAIKLKTMDYIDSPIDFNDFMGLTYQRLFSNGTNYVETLSKCVLSAVLSAALTS